MSMPAWLTDVPTVPNNNDNGTFEPSMAFMATPTSANFDSHPPPTQQFQQRMQNGDVRNPSPGLHNSVYQTQSIIPAKRPRAQGGDSYGASPGRSTGALQTSRSQTPQHGPYSGLHGNSNGSHQVQPPTPYQHLRQGGSSNASPSPIMQDQNFNAPPISQRLQTASPSPFSPAMQNFVPQASPPQSDYGGLVDNLQNGGHAYGHGMLYGAPPTQHLTPPPGAVPSGGPGSMPASYAPTLTHLQQQQYQQQRQQYQQQQQHQQHQHQQQQMQLQLQLQHQQQQQQQRRMYELRQQEMVRRLAANNNAAQYRHQNSAANPAVGSSNQMVNYQQAIRAQQVQNSMPRSGNVDVFVRNIGRLMHRRGLPFDPHPTVGGRPLHIVQLYSTVMRLGGSRRVTATGSWPAVATRLHFNSVQYPTAAQDMQSYWNTNLAPCEELLHKHQTQSMQASMPPQSRGETLVNMRNQLPDASGATPSRRESGSNDTTPVKQINSQLTWNNDRQAHVNGYATPQPNQMHAQPPPSTGTPQAILSDQQQDTLPRPKGVPNQPAIPNIAKRKTQPSPRVGDAVRENPFENVPRQIEMSSTYQPVFRDISNYGTGEASATHGGVNVSAFEKATNELERYRPNVPAAHELGIVDLRALTMSLRCGAHAEVRLALDTLATLSRSVLERGRPVMEASEDLIDALVECADEQVELLAENASEVSDVMLISPYEDVMRGCRYEIETLQEVHEFGTLEYHLDRAVDKLICITTILRNLSFSPHNHSLLAEPCVIKFMTTVIRYLGTRNMLLRTNRNTLDFAKDIVIYLSNVSHTIELSGKEDALCLLHFLLSFAPCPAPTNPGCETVMFTSYSPTIHCYLPPAVDSLAKILTRDEPNRTYYRSIFAMDSASSPPYDLLTRAIALAVAPIPNDQVRVLETVRLRRPFLAQGLLAAGILVTLIPTTEHTLARAWLASQDGFSLRLLSIVLLLSNQRPPVAQVHPSTRQLVDPDPEAYGMITTHAIALLRKLAQRAKDSDSQDGGVPIGVIPKRSTLLRLLRAQVIDPSIVQQVCAYSQLGD